MTWARDLVNARRRGRVSWRQIRSAVRENAIELARAKMPGVGNAVRCKRRRYVVGIVRRIYCWLREAWAGRSLTPFEPCRIAENPSVRERTCHASKVAADRMAELRGGLPSVQGASWTALPQPQAPRHSQALDLEHPLRPQGRGSDPLPQGPRAPGGRAAVDRSGVGADCVQASLRRGSAGQKAPTEAAPVVAPVRSLVGRLSARLRASGPRGSDRAGQRLREALGDAPRLLASLSSETPARAAAEILRLAGAFDLGQKRGLWAQAISRAHGHHAAARLLWLCADVARARNIESVGAVVARRLPEFVTPQWRRVAPEDAVKTEPSIHEPAGRSPGPSETEPPENPGVCFDALDHYRAGAGMPEIAKRTGLNVARARAAVAWAVQNGAHQD